MHSADRHLTDVPPPPLGRERRLLIAYWIVTYAIFTIRGRLLLDEPLPWLSAKRLLAITLGTLFLWVAISIQKQVAGKRLSIRLASVVLTSIGAAGALLVVRSTFGVLGGADDSTIADELRWLLIWIGYFLAWVGLFAAISAAAPGAELKSSSHGVAAVEPLRAPAESDDALWVFANQQRLRIPRSAIEYVEAEGNYVRVHTADSSGLLRASMADIEQRLGTADFVRTHRSTICRKSSITAVERAPTGAYVAILTGGSRIPIGRRMGKDILDELRARRR